MLNTWSISTGRGVEFTSGIVSPLAKLGAACPSGSLRGPSVICTYLRPSAETGRTSSVELRGSGLMLVWSFSVSSAVTEPSRCRRGAIVLTTPTRWPPMRTSLPRTRFAALGMSALSS